MNEYSHEQIIAIEEFAEGLRECFQNYLNNHQDNISKIFMDYVLQTLVIHLQLARIKFDRYSNNFAKANAQ